MSILATTKVVASSLGYRDLKTEEQRLLLTVLFQAMMYLRFFQQVLEKLLCYALLLLLFGASGFPFP